MPASVEAAVLELRRQRPYWGPRRIALELKTSGSSRCRRSRRVYRCLVRAGVIDPGLRRRRGESFPAVGAARPMELWQMDVVGGFALADRSTAKALTGMDDHSRFSSTGSAGRTGSSTC